MSSTQVQILWIAGVALVFGLLMWWVFVGSARKHMREAINEARAMRDLEPVPPWVTKNAGASQCIHVPSDQPCRRCGFMAEKPVSLEDIGKALAGFTQRADLTNLQKRDGLRAVCNEAERQYQGL